MTNRRELQQLALRLHRDLAVRAHLKTLLAATDTAIALVRRDVLIVNARIARRPPHVKRTP